MLQIRTVRKNSSKAELPIVSTDRLSRKANASR